MTVDDNSVELEYIDGVNGLLIINKDKNTVTFNDNNSRFRNIDVNLGQSYMYPQTSKLVSSFVIEGRLTGWIKLDVYDPIDTLHRITSAYINVKPVIYNRVGRSVGYHQALSNPDGEIHESITDEAFESFSNPTKPPKVVTLSPYEYTDEKAYCLL